MKKLFGLFTIALSLILSSCNTSHGVSYAYSSGNSNSKRMERKIIYNSTYSIAVKNIDTTIKKIEALAEKNEGYMVEKGSDQIKIRIPNNNLDSVSNSIKEMGKVVSYSQTGTDVTDKIFDSELRLENADKSRKRYLELLNKAEDVQSILLIEKELERLNETIELLKGKLQKLNHLVEYSTITINVKEKKKPGILGYIGVGLYEGVKWLFVRN